MWVIIKVLQRELTAGSLLNDLLEIYSKLQMCIFSGELVLDINLLNNIGWYRIYITIKILFLITFW